MTLPLVVLTLGGNRQSTTRESSRLFCGDVEEFNCDADWLDDS